MGCSDILTQSQEQHLCIFAKTGFIQDGREFLACGTSYHPGCIVVGDPFRTRLGNGRGLKYPSVCWLPNFVCECCTVRAMLGRELIQGSDDTSLLMLKRMRIIDQMNIWAGKTLQGYQSCARRIAHFEVKFGVTCLVPTKVTSLLISPAIAIMWVKQQYSLETPSKRHDALEGDRIPYNTSRKIRTAASQYYMMSSPRPPDFRMYPYRANGFHKDG